jgi:PAS domain S-box-containing protein
VFETVTKLGLREFPKLKKFRIMSVTNGKARILIVDDDLSSREILYALLKDNYECMEAHSAEEGLKKLRCEKFNLVLSDIQMPGMSGLEMVPQVKKLDPDATVIMISGLQGENAVKAMRAGAFDYITKPFDIHQIEVVVRRALEHQTLFLAKRNAELENFRLASIVESSDDAIISKSFDGTILTWNKGAERIFGYRSDEVCGLNISIIFPAEQLDEEKEILERIKRGEHINNYETIRKRKDGMLIPVSLSVSPIKNADGEIVGVSKIARDISSHKKAEQALRQSEERYRAFIEQSTEGIWRFEINNPFSVWLPVQEQIEQICLNTRLAECNNAMALQYGFQYAEQLIGKRIDDFLVPTDPLNERHLQDFIESDYKLIDTETLETDKNGQNKYFLSNLTGIVENEKLVRIWGTQRDVTLAKQTEQAFLEAEKQRRQSQKIEAVGRLAGGVAHDFNNFLAVIMLHVDMLNLQLPVGSPLLYRIGEIKSVTDNAAAMVRQLLAFSRKQPMQPHPIVLNHVVKEFIKILRPLVGEDIEVRLNLDTGLGVCFVDSNQITQILMNLVVNARDAMPKGGVINIETSNISLKKRSVKHKAQPLGKYIQLSISDSGTGIDSKIQERIFEPFFTTKEIGKGTGLGLATVYGIIKQSNGFVWFESEINQGTTFKIHFPRVDQPAEIVKTETISMTTPQGSETVLLVEDEEQIRRVAVEVLSALGYQVFEASNGIQAVQLAELFSKPIDLLITDVVMPRMNGRDLADKIKVLHPETAILFISGYTDDIIAHHGALEENVLFLGKPFSHQELAVKVREALDS